MDGILALWKEKGMTSHDCVYKLRKILKIKKIGHAGTLDPDVDGVLPVAIGKGTKVIEYMMDSGKTYTGEITFGVSTTTEDASGEVVEKSKLNHSSLNTKEIDQMMEEMLGEQIQVPPMYSAVRVNGKRLYEYARAGEKVDRPRRKIKIFDFFRTSDVVYNSSNQTISFQFHVKCGKGTYIRTLAVDLGKKLGIPSHMSQLTRTSASGIDDEMSVTLDEVEKLYETEQFNRVLQPLEIALKDIESYTLTDDEWNKVKNGTVFLKKDFRHLKFPIVFYYNNLAVAIYDIHPNKPNLLKPKKVLRTEV